MYKYPANNKKQFKTLAQEAQRKLDAQVAKAQCGSVGIRKVLSEVDGLIQAEAPAGGESIWQRLNPFA